MSDQSETETPTSTPCSIPECNTDGTGEPCDRHETEQAHAEGEHAFCGLECEVTLTSEQLRNAILCQAIPGSPAMLAELERRAAQQPASAVEARAAGRRDGLLEGAAALQAVIDRDRAVPNARGQSWVALGGARQILLDLLGQDTTAAELTTQYGFRLRDSTLLDFDTKAHRDRRMAEFVAAEWEVTPLTRQVRPAQYGEWAEETAGEQRPLNPPHPGGTVYKTVADVDTFAAAAHHGQVDKIGVPYIEHVRAVAAGLAPFGDDMVIAGLLHDVLEDTDWTAGQLRAVGISARALAAVEAVTNQPGVPYEEKIRRITSNPDAVLVKIADNAHNSRPDRAAQLPPEKRERLAAKYRAARAVLWPAAGRADIEAIVSIVNPALLAELGEVDA